MLASNISSTSFLRHLLKYDIALYARNSSSLHHTNASITSQSRSSNASGTDDRFIYPSGLAFIAPVEEASGHNVQASNRLLLFPGSPSPTEGPNATKAMMVGTGLTPLPTMNTSYYLPSVFSASGLAVTFDAGKNNSGVCKNYDDGDSFFSCCSSQGRFWTERHSIGTYVTERCDYDAWGMTWVTSLHTECSTTTTIKYDTPFSLYNECIDTCVIEAHGARLFYWPTPTTTDTSQYAPTATLGNLTL